MHEVRGKLRKPFVPLITVNHNCVTKVYFVFLPKFVASIIVHADDTISQITYRHTVIIYDYL